ncbi:hypothetical protein [Burkholderia sp. BCC0322]|uniref:hypothetical protein n=1 Tax=unclassified Burkholderia TaxID=2613784 RepID=UPI00158F44F9|nr:hypothetical protein [Burkholderia sp. BCC0322]
MDRQIVYAGQIPLETDLLNTNRNTYTALGMLIQDMLGTNTVFSGLACVPTSPAGMTVNVNPGRVYSLQQRDPTAYSSLGQDTTNQIMKQGILMAATNFSCPAPATSGYSVNYLISASFLEQDTNAVVLPYYNSTNPQQAFSGPPVNGQSSGTAQNTTRQDTIQLTLTPGVAAATGSQQTPATPTGQIPLWVVTVAYGQSTITASSINAVAGSPFAPTGGYFQAVGERYSSIINASASQTLTTAALGALINVTSTGTTQTLPPASSCPNGTSITVVYMQSSGSAIVARNGTDTLSFGQGSSSNSITLSPGEEVQFVSNGSNGWVSAGQTLSTGVTATQFDNSQKQATTAFVQRALGNFSGFTALNANTTLTAFYAGQLIQWYGASGGAITLPTGASMPSGGTISIVNFGSGPITVNTQGSDFIWSAGNVQPVTLQIGDSLLLVCRGSTEWDVAGGTAAIQFSQTRGVTAAQFDSSTRLATTAFVQRALGNFQNFYSYQTSQTLIGAQSGAVINFWGTSAATFTLPAASAMPTCGALYFINSGSAALTVSRAGTDAIVGSGGNTSVVLNPGDSLRLVTTNGANQWIVIGGSAQLQFNPVSVGAATQSQHAVQRSQSIGNGATTLSTPTRVVGTTYTNSTGRPLFIMLSVGSGNGNGSTGSGFGLSINGTVVASLFGPITSGISVSGTISAVVPVGATYVLNNTGLGVGFVGSWTEY